MDDEHEFESSEPPPSYPGEDTRLTSSKELSGWYFYGWAAEVFVICGIGMFVAIREENTVHADKPRQGSFIPITLEQLARERGVLLTDHTKPCAGTSHSQRFLPRVAELLPPRSEANNTVPPGGQGQCIIRFLGAEINTASFAMYTFSISVAVQALLIISMSGAADHGRYRKSFLLSFAYIGSISTMLFLTVVPSIYAFGAFLAIVSNTCFGASFVLLNSFLPILVRRHPSIDGRNQDSSTARPTGYGAPEIDEEDNDEESHEPSEALLRTSPARQVALSQISKNSASPQLQLSTRISSYGIGIGYLAAVIVQTLGIVIVIVMGLGPSSTTFTLRLVVSLVGLWWFVFTFPAALWLRPRPGPPLSYTSKDGQNRTWAGYVAYAWKSLFKTLRRARHLKDVLLFLAAWFLLSDAIATVSGTAVLFAKTDLQMPPAALALISLIGTLTGVIGAFSWSTISQWLHLKPSQTIMACICLFEIIPIYGLLGFIPAVQRFGVFGLQQPWEMYPLGAVYGFVLGGLSSYCRSLFGELIPPGSEAAFYALYAITDKGSSVFGPAIVGLITDRWGEIRPAFVFLAVLIFIPLPLMLLVDVDRGKRDGAAMAEALKDTKAPGAAELFADSDDREGPEDQGGVSR